MYALRYCSNMALVLVVCLSVCGWNAVLSLYSIPNFPVVSFHRSQVNRVPLSVMIWCGSPCSLTISFMKTLAKCRLSRSFEHGMKWLILVRRSMTTSIVSCPSDFGRSLMESIAIDFHRRSGGCFTAPIRRVHVGRLWSFDMCPNSFWIVWYLLLSSANSIVGWWVR